MKNTKIASILISGSMSILLFAGCSKAPTNIKTQLPTTNKSTNNTINTQIPKTYSTAEMKTLYADTLKELITAKTITMTESNKVFVELTKNMPQMAKTTTRNLMDSNKKLSALVKSHVITQSQADKINQKIKNSMNKIK